MWVNIAMTCDLHENIRFKKHIFLIATIPAATGLKLNSAIKKTGLSRLERLIDVPKNDMRKPTTYQFYGVFCESQVRMRKIRNRFILFINTAWLSILFFIYEFLTLPSRQLDNSNLTSLRSRKAFY